MKTVKKIALLVTASVFFIACQSEPTLQKYYVENQNNKGFVVLDVPASLFLGDNSALPEEDKNTLKTIKKANILAFPITGENHKEYEKENNTVENILNDPKYKTLMRMGVSGKQVNIMYLGEPDAIDEVIAYANDNTKGFAVARILGNDMNVSAMVKLMKSVTDGSVNVDLQGLGDIHKMLENEHHKNEVVEDSSSVEE